MRELQLFMFLLCSKLSIIGFGRLPRKNYVWYWMPNITSHPQLIILNFCLTVEMPEWSSSEQVDFTCKICGVSLYCFGHSPPVNQMRFLILESSDRVYNRQKKVKCPSSTSQVSLGNLSSRSVWNVSAWICLFFPAAPTALVRAVDRSQKKMNTRTTGNSMEELTNVQHHHRL